MLVSWPGTAGSEANACGCLYALTAVHENIWQSCMGRCVRSGSCAPSALSAGRSAVEVRPAAARSSSKASNAALPTAGGAKPAGREKSRDLAAMMLAVGILEHEQLH